jgi:hypothetical protein
MFPIPPQSALLPALPYRTPTVGRDYWILDDALADPDTVRRRCMSKTDWIQGFPFQPESWPGLRAIPALTDAELAPIEARVRQATGAEKLWQQVAPDGARLNHNCVQVVGERECGPRPHTDSRALCKYAGVLYLNPSVPDRCGTSFYRQRLANGQPGGNSVEPPHRNLVDALGSRFVPPNSFMEDIQIPHRYNRLLVYRGNLIHTATRYWGTTLADKRMAAVFFWMA